MDSQYSSKKKLNWQNSQEDRASNAHDPDLFFNKIGNDMSSSRLNNDKSDIRNSIHHTTSARSFQQTDREERNSNFKSPSSNILRKFSSVSHTLEPKRISAVKVELTSNRENDDKFDAIKEIDLLYKAFKKKEC